MKNLFLILLQFVFIQLIKTQTFSELNSVPLEITVLSQNSILVSWDNSISSTGYSLYRKIHGTTGWGGVYASLSATTSSYLDNVVTTGQIYEYKIVRNSTTTGYGFACGAIESRIDSDPGLMVLLIDDYFTSLTTEIQTLTDDLKSDGWFVHTHYVNRNQSIYSVKQIITDEYNADPTRIKSVFLLGHVPVPYSGNINPDGHPDHKGAWPADIYYGDMDGTWTDNTVSNTTATDPRQHNIPGDMKFDQNTLGSAELEVGRVDFYNLPTIPFTELELMASYLLKLHDFKSTNYTPQDKAIVEDNFQAMEEGFASGGLVSFSPIIGSANVTIGDYTTSLLSNDYLWSYGTGPGTYVSSQDIVTVNDFVNSDLNSTFTMLFGSYFGDWDSQDNLLKAAMVSGRILASSWSGRPHIYYHSMGVGDRLGECIKQAQNNTTEYFASTTNSFKKSIHIAQLGDPSLRSHYTNSPSGLSVLTDTDGSTLLSWLPPSGIVDGYFIYRRKTDQEFWTQINTSIIIATSYHDLSLTNGGSYEYMVRAAKKQYTGSGNYFNESLGVRATINSNVGIIEKTTEKIQYFPNPFSNLLTIRTLSENVTIEDLSGRVLVAVKKNTPEITINTEEWASGIYFVISDRMKIKILKQ